MAEVSSYKINFDGEEMEVITKTEDISDDEESSAVQTYLFQELTAEDEMLQAEEQGDEDGLEIQEIVEHECKKCKCVFNGIESLREHLELCKDKTIEISEEQLVQMERDSEEMEKKGKCFCCEEKLETAHAGHVRCPLCPKSFKNDQSFLRHSLLLHSDSNEFPCNVCNAKCPSKVILWLHFKAHQRGKPFSCKNCGKDFTRKYHLDRHILHSNCDPNVKKDELNCNVCHKTFIRLDNLRTHLRSHVVKEPKKRDYKCPFCDKAFYGSSMLNIHIRTHTGERPFPCDLCKKSFPSTAALVKHRRSHTGEKPYECPSCMKCFAAKEVLNRHVKTHTGERPHVCPHCGKRFIQATQLKTHLVTHGEEPFKCRYCGAVFNRNSGLVKHIRSDHEDKLPSGDANNSMKTEKDNEDEVKFCCEFCSKAFPTKVGLKSHVKNIHASSSGDKKDIKCDVCNIILDSKKKMTAHVAAKHSHPATSPPKKLEPKTKILNTKAKSQSQVTSARHKFERKVKVLNKQYTEESSSTDSSSDNEIVIEIPVESGSRSSKRKLEKLVEEIEEMDNENSSKVPPQSNFIIKKLKKEKKLDEVSEEKGNVIFMKDKDLIKSVGKLLNLLLEEDMLKKFGWPNAKVENVLYEVIRECGHKPADYDRCADITTKIRENVKLLLTVVIDNESIKELLNNHTIDEVISRVLKMAQVDSKN